jgi:hypothetical protein
LRRRAGLLGLLLLLCGRFGRSLLRHIALGAHAFAAAQALGSVGFNGDHGQAEKQGNR